MQRGATGITVREFKDGYFENKHVSLEQVLASQSSHPDYVPVEIIDHSEIKDEKKKKPNTISLVPIQSMKSPSKSKKMHPSSSTSDLTATNGVSIDISASKPVSSSTPSLSQSMAHSATMPNLQQLSGKVMKKKSIKDTNGVSSIPLLKKKSSSPPQEPTSFSSLQPVSTSTLPSSQAPQVFIGPKSLQPTSPFLPALITPDFLLKTREPVAARAQSLPTTSHMQQHLMMKNNPFVQSMQQPTVENSHSSSAENSDDEFIIRRSKESSSKKSTSPSFSDNSDEEEDVLPSRSVDALQFTMDKVNGQLSGSTAAAGVLTEEDIMQMALGDKKGVVPSAKFAGGAWTNSPAPQTLPLPKFDKH